MVRLPGESGRFMTSSFSLRTLTGLTCLLVVAGTLLKMSFLASINLFLSIYCWCGEGLVKGAGFETYELFLCIYGVRICCETATPPTLRSSRLLLTIWDCLLTDDGGAPLTSLRSGLEMLPILGFSMGPLSGLLLPTTFWLLDCGFNCTLWATTWGGYNAPAALAAAFLLLRTWR